MQSNYNQQRVIPIQKPRRKRGVVLTLQGMQKLQEAIQRSETQENFGYRYTLEALGARLGLDPRTVAKVLEQEVGVDKRTLDRCFSTFRLQLNSSDYYAKRGAYVEPTEVTYAILSTFTPLNHQRRFYATRLEVTTEMRPQLVELLKRTLSAIADLNTQLRQAQLHQAMSFYHSSKLLEEIVTELEQCIELFAVG